MSKFKTGDIVRAVGLPVDIEGIVLVSPLSTHSEYNVSVFITTDLFPYLGEVYMFKSSELELIEFSHLFNQPIVLIDNPIKCQCPISDLLNFGHNKGCIEERK